MIRFAWVRVSSVTAALAAAILITRATAADAGTWLNEHTGGQIGELAAPWIAGFAQPERDLIVLLPNRVPTYPDDDLAVLKL